MQASPQSIGVDRVFETSDGVSLHYIDAGDGAPLVLLPGWSQSAAMFRYQIEHFAPKRRVVALDPRGHGESSKPSHGYNAHRMAADLRELIVALDLQNVDLLGHSGGVKYIWAYWELYAGDRLRRLVIVDDSPRLVDNPAWSATSRAEIGPMYYTGDLDRFALDLMGPGGESFTDKAIKSMFSPDFVAREPELLDWIVAENLKMPRDLSIELLYATSGIDWRGTIKRVRLPALVIGAAGSTHKATVLKWVSEQIPGARLRIWGRHEGGSHFMFIENPEQFNAELDQFFG